MRRFLAILVTIGLLLVSSLAFASGASAGAIASTVTCNNALGNGGAVCEVTVVNTITPSGGTAVVTVRECTGSAGVPDTTCTNTTSPLTEPVTAVTQCNGSINGGGGQLLCSVNVTNNFVGITPPPTITAATVNQCVGSADSGSAMVCTPFPVATTGATITQCNGSSNEGGASLTCTASGTQSSGLSVLINQCNGSSNGGGTLTVCSASITNNLVAGGGGSTSTPVPSIPNSATPPTSDDPGSGPSPVVLVGFFLLLVLAGRSTLRGIRTR